MPVVDALLTKGDVARQARVSIKTIERFAKDRLLPAPIALGTGARRRVRFLASDIDAWLKMGCPDRQTFEAAKCERAGVTA